MSKTVIEPQPELDAPKRDSVFLRELTLRNFLSFGPNTEPIKLGPLNVLIGPNASGKSNLIEAICFLRSARSDMQAFTRGGGGVSEWIWKGAGREGTASVGALVLNPQERLRLRHTIEFGVESQAFRLVEERLASDWTDTIDDKQTVYFERIGDESSITLHGKQGQLSRSGVKLNESILSALRDPIHYPEITNLGDNYDLICAYRDWHFGRKSIVRDSEPTDVRGDRLVEDASNLWMRMVRLRRTAARDTILSRLKDLYAGIEDYEFEIAGSRVLAFIREEGGSEIPAVRLSDGTLRYFALLAILCDPSPPPLICIEEPELGLHPDLIPDIADLLVEASERTQLVVTTHSEVLVDCFTDKPECVMVCEKHEGQTQIERLDPTLLSIWLDKYRLGRLWTSGELGGKRW